MKNIKSVLLVALLIATLLVLTGCGCEHEEVIDKAVKATCTVTGLTQGSHCSKCGETLKEQTTIAATGHSYSAATCTKAQTCTTCGQTKGSALGHTTASGTCSRCGISFGSWKTDYYVDEFNQPTSQAYVINKSHIVGSFSNSATNDSKLYVDILADKDDIAIFLYEYGTYPVKNSSSRNYDYYDITMKTSDGKKYTLTGTMYCGDDRIFINENYESLVLSALKSGDKVSFYLVEDRYTTSTYLFEVDTNNFADQYSKIK